MSSLEEKTLTPKQYNGTAKTHKNTTEEINISKIETLPISKETSGEYIPCINGGLSYNCKTKLFKAEILLPTVMTDTNLSLYQSDNDPTNIYLTYYGVNQVDKSEIPTTYNLWKLNYQVELNNVKKGDTLTVRMLDWRNGNPLSERTGDPETSRGTETTVEDGDGDFK